MNDLRFQSNAALIRHIPLTSTNILPVQAALGQTGIMEGVDYRAARVIGDVRPVPDSPWFMVARENITEVFAPLRKHLSQLIFTFGVLLLGAAAGVGLIWRNQRARFYRREMKAEAERAQMSRLYAALSQINQAIVWTRRTRRMLEKICRALVEYGGFRMAWIGQPEAETRRVKPVAKWGDSRGLPFASQLFMRRKAGGPGPIGTAIREREKLCLQLILPATPHPSVARAGEPGWFPGLGGFPIRQGGAVCGAVWSTRAKSGFFRDKEIALLEEAATDVSFALDNLAREKSRRQAEEAVLRSQAEFKDLFDNAPVGFHEINTEGRIVRINNTELKMLGYAHRGIAGAVCLEDFRGCRIVPPGRAGKTGRRVVAAESKGFRADVPPEGRLHFPVLIKDRLLEREDGSITGIRAAIQDITDRRKAEEALDYERDLLRALLDNSPDEIYFKDTQSRFVKCSRAMAAQFGVESPDALVGRRILISSMNRTPVRLMRTNRKSSAPARRWLTRESGRNGRTGASHGRPARNCRADGAGKIIGIIGISRDITERKRAEEALRGSETMLQEAQRIASTGSYSHDIASGHWSSSPVLDRPVWDRRPTNARWPAGRPWSIPTTAP